MPAADKQVISNADSSVAKAPDCYCSHRAVARQGTAADERGGITLAFVAQQSMLWKQLQKELTALSSRGTRQVAARSGHVIQFEQPELVISAILAQVQQLQGN